MWNKLRARHYALILLLGIVTLETSAIAIDRFLSKGEDTAFTIDGKFRNNSFLDRFQIAEANAAPLPPTLSAPRDLARVSRLSVNKTELLPAAGLPNRDPLFAGPVPAAPESAQVQNWLEYTVRKGDSLDQIGGLFGVKSDHLAAANKMKEGKSLKAGQKLRIPMVSSRLVYSVKGGDSLSKIASRFGITIQDLIVENSLKTYSLTEGQEIGIPLRKKASEMTLVKDNAPVEAASLKIVRETAPTAPAREALALIPSKNSLAMVANPQLPVSLKIVKLPGTPAAAMPAPAPVAAPVAAVPPASAVKPVAAPAPAVKSLVVAALKSTTSTPSAGQLAGDDEIKIVMHTVKDGDSLSKLARQYKTTISQIVANNDLTNSNLKVGKSVKIPVNKRFYRVMQVSSRKLPAKTSFQMPVKGRITDGYGWRFHPVWRKRLFHAGVDLAAGRGTPINAALPGQVVYAGWRTGYGKLVIVRHANGLSTRYGHCSSFTVRRGQMVKAGQVIARVGATGVATGPHLHFEIRRNGKTLNPRTLLSMR